MKCDKCKLDAAGKTRLPTGWKRHNGTVSCKACWSSSYVMRAICVPIASPLNGEWKDLRTILQSAWERATNATRWAMKRLLENDIVRDESMKKIPKMPRVYLYGEKDWSGWSQSAAALLRSTEAKYRSKRFDIVWRGTSRLPDIRYPQPYPVHNAAWKLDANEERIAFSVTALGLDVILKLGPRYKRQSATLRKLASGELLGGEASIYRGNRGDIMVKIAYWKPIEKHETQSGELLVRTDADSFLVALNAKDERLWILNGDRIRQVLVKHDRGQQRLREDLKFERRPTTKIEQQDNQRICRKQRDRVKSFVQETAAQVVGYAKRRHLATIKCDLTMRDYFRHFPWFELELRLRQKAEEAGIEIEFASGETAAKIHGPLAKPNKV